MMNSRNVNDTMVIQKSDINFHRNEILSKFFSTFKFKYYEIPIEQSQSLAEKMNKITYC